VFDPPVDLALLVALETGAWPGSPLLERPEVMETLARARQAVRSTSDPFEAWDRVGAFDGLFHLRRGALAGTRRHLVRRMRASAVRLALCSSRHVPAAPCVAHPITVPDAVAFHGLGPFVLEIEAHARRAADAFDAIGQPTGALAASRIGTSRRVIVWRTRAKETRLSTCRSVALLAMKLIAEHADHRLGVRAPDGHCSEWNRPRVAAFGLLAWRAAVARGLHVSPTPRECGSRLFVAAEAVGRAYADLVNPFEPLFTLGTSGVEIVAWSSETITLELRVP
jgi:hypothetical protein